MLRKILAVPFIVLGLLLLSYSAAAAHNDHHNEGKITICHATHSNSNPYVQITVDDSAVDGSAHGDADHSHHIHDIIPPKEGVSFGLNWDSVGIPVWENQCKIPTTPTTTVPPTTAPPTTQPPVTTTPAPSTTVPAPTTTPTPSTTLSAPSSTSPAPSSEPSTSTSTVVAPPASLAFTGPSHLTPWFVVLGSLGLLVGAALVVAGNKEVSPR